MRKALSILFLLSSCATALGATTQSPLNGAYRLFANSLQRDTFETQSTFECGMLNCEFTWTVALPFPDNPRIQFNWAGINLTGQLPGNRQWSTSIRNIPAALVADPAQAQGLMTFTGGSGFYNNSETPSYYQHPAHVSPQQSYGIKDLLNDVGDVLFSSTELRENPPLISFESRVERLAGDQYAYAYHVINHTAQAIEFDWPDAELNGTVSSNDTLSHEFVSVLAPYDVYGFINASRLGEELQGPASTIAPLAPSPIPAPVAVVLFASGLLTLLMRQIVARRPPLDA